MGLGNSYYAQDDLVKAEAAFRDAIRWHPTAGSAFNNLAHVLSEQNRLKEALEAARQAFSLGGPQRDLHQKTLDEIQNKIK